MVIVSAAINPGNTARTGYVSFAVGGATTQAATDGRAVSVGGTTSTLQLSSTSVVTGLAAGNNTFTLQYKRSGSSGGGGQNITYSNRTITVIPLG